MPTCCSVGSDNVAARYIGIQFASQSNTVSPVDLPRCLVQDLGGTSAFFDPVPVVFVALLLRVVFEAALEGVVHPGLAAML